MTSTARRHHYLPQAYLAAFTDTGKKDGRFYVLDPCSGACFRTSPKNVAVELDFNRVDIEGKPPDVIEQDLSTFEDSATQAIRSVNRTITFPTDEDCNWIITLLCLIAVRNPKLRKSFNRSRELAIHIIGDLLVSDEKTWAHHLKKAQEAGYYGETTISFEDEKKFIEERRYKVEFAPESNLRVELRTFDSILKILKQRTWSLLVVPSSGPDFICSDHPIALTWKEPGKGGPIGYGLKNTGVFFPLGPKTGFYGVYEDPLPHVVHMNPTQVSKMNTHVSNSAERHVFSATGAFFIWDEGRIKEVDCRPKCRAGTARHE
jgi:Protein of unknown function (DUF4238)